MKKFHLHNINDTKLPKLRTIPRAAQYPAILLLLTAKQLDTIYQLIKAILTSFKKIKNTQTFKHNSRILYFNKKLFQLIIIHLAKYK